MSFLNQSKSESIGLSGICGECRINTKLENRIDYNFPNERYCEKCWEYYDLYYNQSKDRKVKKRRFAIVVNSLSLETQQFLNKI